MDLQLNYSKKQKKNRISCTITFDSTTDIKKAFSDASEKVIKQLNKKEGKNEAA